MARTAAAHPHQDPAIPIAWIHTRMKSLLPLVLALGACTPAFADQPAPTREHFAPRGMEFAYHDVHYTPVVKVGTSVIVSGIPAAGPGTYEEKVRRMFVSLQKQLEIGGASLADVVELTSFHVAPTDPKSFQEEFLRFAPIHHEFFPSHYPAWSAVGTTALLSPGAVVELRAVAVIGSGRAPKADIATPPRPAGAASAG